MFPIAFPSANWARQSTLNCDLRESTSEHNLSPSSSRWASHGTTNYARCHAEIKRDIGKYDGCLDACHETKELSKLSTLEQ